MKIGSKLQYDVPDDYCSQCPLRDEMMKGQSAICYRCPVLICKGSWLTNDPPIIEPQDFRDDWANEWVQFFKTWEYPNLYL